VHGTIRVDSPHPPRVHLGENTEDVDIRVLPASE
jgi:hypothetical protein